MKATGQRACYSYLMIYSPIFLVVHHSTRDQKVLMKIRSCYPYH